MSREDDHDDDYDLDQEDYDLDQEDDDLDQEDDDLEPEDEDLEIKDEDLRWDIRNIKDPIIREDETQKVKKIFNEEKDLRNRLDRGEISLGTYDAIYIEKIKPQIRKARTRCGRASVGLTPDDFGDITEDVEFLYKEDTRLTGLKERIKTKISNIGPDVAQEDADRLYEEEELSKDAYDRISRQIRLHRRYNKR